MQPSADPIAKEICRKPQPFTDGLDTRQTDHCTLNKPAEQSLAKMLWWLILL
jgi:hypothetical protein